MRSWRSPPSPQCSSRSAPGRSPPSPQRPNPPILCLGAAPVPHRASTPRSRNAVAVTRADPTFRITASTFSVSGAQRLFWNVERLDTGFEFGASALADTWSVTFDVGSLDPRIAFVRGMPGTVVRNRAAGTVTVTAMPAQQTTDDCSSATGELICTEVPGREWEAYLGGDFSDAGSWTDPIQRAAFDGTDIFTTISYLNDTPVITTDAVTGAPVVSLELANSHFRLDGVTVFRGFIRHVVPAGFLATVYGIDDPATLRSAGIVSSLGGAGAGTLSVASSPEGIVIEGSGITFSARILEIRAGRVTPLRPKNVRTVATFDRRARVAFRAATPRGSAVDAHIVRCAERRGDDVERIRTTNRRAVVRGLEPGRAYVCRVRGVSDAGRGLWSRSIRIPANR